MSTTSRSPGSAPLDRERAAELVHGRQRGVEDVLGGVVVVDRAVEPFPAVDPEAVAGFDRGDRGDLGVPAVVADVCLVGEFLCRVEGENQLGHGWTPFGAARRSRPRQAAGGGMGDRRASGTAPWRGRDDLGLEGAALRAPQPAGQGGRSTCEHRRREHPNRGRAAAGARHGGGCGADRKGDLDFTAARAPIDIYRHGAPFEWIRNGFPDRDPLRRRDLGKYSQSRMYPQFKV